MTDIDPRLHAFRPDLADLRLRGQVEAAAFVEGEPAILGAPRAPMRSRPEEAASWTSEILGGEALHVFERRSGWAWVQRDGDGYVGYVPEAAISSPSGALTHRVTALLAPVRAEPDVKAPVTATLSFGVRLAGLGERGAFMETPAGFVPTSAIAPLSTRALDPVETARRFLGLPYVWGGRSAFGIDCSGLVQLALEAAGQPCPRDSDQQLAALGQPVDHPQPGDLAFFPGHVGWVVEGDQLLHANAYHMAVTEDPILAVVERAGCSAGYRRLGTIAAA